MLKLKLANNGELNVSEVIEGITSDLGCSRVLCV